MRKRRFTKLGVSPPNQQALLLESWTSSEATDDILTTNQTIIQSLQRKDNFAFVVFCWRFVYMKLETQLLSVTYLHTVNNAEETPFLWVWKKILHHVLSFYIFNIFFFISTNGRLLKLNPRLKWQSLSKILSVFTLIRTRTTLIIIYQDFMIVFIL